MPTSGATPASFSKSSTSISSGRRKPFLFLSNLWRKKKVLEIGDDIIFDRNHRTRSEPSVISYSCTTTAMSQSAHHHNQQHSKNVSMLTMTPGRFRDLDEDMHALRLSRQDNPFVQKVLASRESLIDTLDDQSDDAILMASEELNSDFCEDPFSLPEVKEHMIRSPPPTSWPRSPCMFTYNSSRSNLESSDDEAGYIYNNQSHVRPHDPFLRTASVPATTALDNKSGQNHRLGGLDIPLSRPKSRTATPGDDSMILRPQFLFEEVPAERRFN